MDVLLTAIAMFLSTQAKAAPATCTEPQTTPAALAAEAKSLSQFAVLANPAPLQTIEAKINGRKLSVQLVRYSRSITPKKGTVFYMCGGPGSPCIGMRPQNIPADYDVVTTDYLGVGVNRKYQRPLDMAIDSQAQLVTAIVRSLHDPSLILYGQSFGTTVATAAGAKLTAKTSSVPKSLRGVVLDGVVGSPSGDYDRGFIRASEAAWNQLSSIEMENFKKAYSKLTLNLSPDRRRGLDIQLTMQLGMGTKATVDYLKNFKKIADYEAQWSDQQWANLQNISCVFNAEPNNHSPR